MAQLVQVLDCKPGDLCSIIITHKGGRREVLSPDLQLTFLKKFKSCNFTATLLGLRCSVVGHQVAVDATSASILIIDHFSFGNC